MKTWLHFLPTEIQTTLLRLPLVQITELRLRVGQPLIVWQQSNYQVFPEVIITTTMLENLMHKAAEYAVYAVMDQITQGFLTLPGGVRLGLSGTVVIAQGSVSALKNLQAVCVRLPHAVLECATAVTPWVFGPERPYNTLIIAPPGAGKTTLLRDLARQITKRYPYLNTLILDERGEIAANYQGVNQLDVGAADVITGGSKMYGMQQGIRSLRPDCILTDEVTSAAEVALLTTTAYSGVTIFASVHATNIADVQAKPQLCGLITSGIFKRIVVLKIGATIGTVVGVYDGAGNLL